MIAPVPLSWWPSILTHDINHSPYGSLRYTSSCDPWGNPKRHVCTQQVGQAVFVKVSGSRKKYNNCLWSISEIKSLISSPMT